MTSYDDVLKSLNDYDSSQQQLIRTLSASNTAKDTQLNEANVQIANLTEWGNNLDAENQDLKEEVANLQEQLADQTTPADPTPEPTPPPTPKVVIGLSAKQSEWDEQIHNIGTNGIKARRIYADLGQGGLDQQSLIKQAVADGEMPVLSYKVGGDVAGAKSGKLDAAAAAAGTFLKSLKVPVRLVIWHEPNPDISGADYVAINKRLIPLISSGDVRVGTFINGWLLENKESTFTPYVPDDLLAMLGWWGIDAYHAGTVSNPDPVNTPGRRINNMLKYADKRGVKLPIGIGEYNAFTAAAVKEAGDVILANADRIEFACMWSSQADPNKDFRLTGDRLAAFKATLADSRVQK